MHTGLGTVDDHAVVALGLPKSADGSKSEGVVPSSHQAEGAAKAAEVAAKAAEVPCRFSHCCARLGIMLGGLPSCV